MKYPKQTTLLLSILFTFLVLSCRHDANSIRVKNWKILYAQDQSFESVSKKSGWESIEAPSDVKPLNPKIKEFQYAWLKGDFEIKENPSGYYGLSTGRIRFSDRIFINNKYIGCLPSEKVNWTPMPRNYDIPEGILKTGKNTFYIKLGLYEDQTGGISDGVLIQGKEEYDSSQFFTNLIYILLPFGIMFLYLGLSTEFLIAFFWDRKEKQNLYVSLILFIGVIYILMYLPPLIPVSYELSSMIKYTSPVIIIIFIMLLIQSMFRIYLTSLNRTIIPLLLFSLVLSTIILHSTLDFTIIIYILLFITIFNAFAFVYLIIRLNSIYRSVPKNTDKSLRYLLISTISMFSFLIIFESYFMFSESYYPGFISIFIPPIFIIFNANLMSRQVKNRRIELDFLYNKLKNNKEHKKDKAVSDTNKEKLKRVMEFINENYYLDLSREGLAAAVDMHPNYMGSQFKIYTGKAVHTYINELRIDEAIRQIESSNSKIIDIAFSVGFESLSTFHRVFKQITGKTPQEYKSNDIHNLSN